MIVPFLALFFLMLDTCYAIFVKANLQYAVQQGVNDAIVFNGSGLVANVESTVAGLAPSNSVVTVKFYSPPGVDSNGNVTPATIASGAGANQAGHIVEVDVTYGFAPLAPLFRSGATISFSASSAAVLVISPPPSL